MKTRQEIEASLRHSRELRAEAKVKLEAAEYGSTAHLVAQLDDALWLGRIEGYKEVLRITEREIG